MEKTAGREVRTVCKINAPIALAWDAWTNPTHLINWWGPAGFTCTVHQMDFEEGGTWKLTLHGPDGTNFPNRSIFKEIIPNKKLVFEHFNPHFITTVIFEALDDETQIDWTLQFDTAEMRDIVVKTHNALEGQKQNIEKLENYLATIST